MDKFKRVIAARILWLSILLAVAVALGIYDVFFASPTMKDSFAFGFQSGAVTACGLLAAVMIYRYRSMLSDEKELQLELNKENDERLRAIRAKAGLPMILITSILMVIAGIVASYFNALIFMVLVSAAVCQLIISIIAKLIYMKKM